MSSTIGRCQTRVSDTFPFLPGVHVTSTAGTRLVHTAPAHGQDEFSLEGNNCTVAEDGLFLPEAGAQLQGLEIFREGGQRVVQQLGKDCHSQ